MRQNHAMLSEKGVCYSTLKLRSCTLRTLTNNWDPIWVWHFEQALNCKPKRACLHTVCLNQTSGTSGRGVGRRNGGVCDICVARACVHMRHTDDTLASPFLSSKLGLIASSAPHSLVTEKYAPQCWFPPYSKVPDETGEPSLARQRQDMNIGKFFPFYLCAIRTQI